MPRRLLVLDAKLVEEMLRNGLREETCVQPGPTRLPQEGGALTRLGWRLVDLR